MCHGTLRDLGEDGQRRIVEVFGKQKPVDGLKIQGHWIAATGEDFVVVEATSVEPLVEAVAAMAPFVDYKIFPILPPEGAVAAFERAIAFRSEGR